MPNTQSKLWSPEQLLQRLVTLDIQQLLQLTRRRLTTDRRVQASLVLLVGAFASLVLDARRKAHKEKLKSKEFHRQSSAVLLSDGWSKEIYVPSGRTKDGQESQSKVVIHPTRRSTFEAHRRLFMESKLKTRTKSSTEATREKKPGLNSDFLREFGAIWSIIVPRLHSKTSGLLLVHALFLASRTYLSLVVARLDGRIVRDLISANGKEFIRGIVLWLLLALPASYTNAMIKFLEAKISIAFRTRLIRYIHDIYLDSRQGYYKLTNTDGGIEGADQYITADLTRFCDAAAALYSNLGKPAVDFFIFSYQLQKNLGPMALVGIFINYGATAWFLKTISPPFGRMAAAEARLEGEYRNAHTKIITNAEEIAFYDGADLERTVLTKTYRRLVSHIANVLRIKVSYNMIEDFMLKYSWSALGYMYASLPVFVPQWTGSQTHESGLPSVVLAEKDFRERDRMKDFITNRRLMLSLADAGGRMMYSIKDLAELAGFTSRVFQLIAVLHRVHASAYRELVEDGAVVQDFSLADVHGTVQVGFEGVRLEHTPIVIPGLGKDLSPGTVLIQDLNVMITPGQHLLISGANGVGKSAVARVIANIWPVYRGLVSKPKPSDIAFIPQRPYLSSGTLRDQIIYPDSHAEMLEKQISDSRLLKILALVKLEYLPGREGGWETKKQWKDVFSGGEKQRVMFARLLYKEPKFAVIDEGTSAVSADVEGLLYETCKKHEITLITISHRPSLLKYHTAQLKLGLGEYGDEWSFEMTGTREARQSVESEIQSLKKDLAQVDAWKARRMEIDRLLMPQA